MAALEVEYKGLQNEYNIAINNFDGKTAQKLIHRMNDLDAMRTNAPAPPAEESAGNNSIFDKF